jgi:hypothetical protein
MKDCVSVQKMNLEREAELSAEQRSSKLGADAFEIHQPTRSRRELRDLRLIHFAISITNYSINQAKMIKPNTLARNMGKRLTLASYESCKSALA